MYEKYERLLSDKGVKTSDVSKATGVDKSTFSHWKKGNYTPKADKLQKIADYFEVPISYFYEDVANQYYESVMELERNENEELRHLLGKMLNMKFSDADLDKIISYAKFIGENNDGNED